MGKHVFVRALRSDSRADHIAEFDSDRPWIADRYYVLDKDGGELSSSRAVTAPTPAGEGDDTLTELPYVGRGAYGVVVRARDPLYIPRAIKLLTSSAYGSVDTDSFANEIRLANKRPFKNVIAIMDYGEGEDARRPKARQFRYYVSHFIDGPTIDLFLTALRTDGDLPPGGSRNDMLHDLLLRLIDDMLAGIAELHEAGVVHMDIKPTNMLVLPAAGGGDADLTRRGKLFVTDLGAAKPVGDLHSGRTFAQRTPYYFPEDWLPALGCPDPLVDNYIDYARLKLLWRDVDLYCLGRSLEEMLLDRGRRRTPRWRYHGAGEADAVKRADEAAKEAFWSTVLGEDFEVLEGLVDRLLRVAEPHFSDAYDAQLAFQTLPRKRARAVLSSVPLLDQYRGIRVRVGPHLVRIASPFDQIVDHPTFQRLKRLQQLSFVSEVFPDGTHTRFAHSLLTYDMAKRYVFSLNRRREFRLLFDRKSVDELLVAALLHDIGQYPFSHTIEDLKKLADLQQVRSQEEDASLTPFREIKHDQDLAADMLDRPDDEGESIGQLLDAWGLSRSSVLYAFSKREKNQDASDQSNLMRDIVSGVIDVDRVSYLLHDSQRTGVPYGAGIDIDGLVEALTVRWNPLATGEERVALGVDDAGLGAVESVLSATYWMYRHVYWRHTNRAFMAAMKFVFRELLREEKITFASYIERSYGKSDWEVLRDLAGLYGRLERPFNPLDALTSGNRLGYRRVLALSQGDGGEDAQVCGRLRRGISFADETAILDELARCVAPVLVPGQILLDVPLKGRLRRPTDASERLPAGTDRDTVAEKGARPNVLVCRRDRLAGGRPEWALLETCSPIARSLWAAEMSSARKIRVFVARSVLDALPMEELGRLKGRIRSVLGNASSTW